MQTRFLLTLALFLATLSSPAQPRLEFPTLPQSRQILTNRDDFIQRLSPFDRSARLKTGQPVTEAQFLNFIATNILEFTPAEKSALTNAFAEVLRSLADLNPAARFPTNIAAIKTTGHEEGNAAYTRAHAIILPAAKLNSSPAALKKLLAHELFHIFTRENAGAKEALYKTIGFRKCAELSFPTNLQRITNPDAPVNDHYIVLKKEGAEIAAIPILYASAARYSAAKGGEFFDYLNFKFLIIDKPVDQNAPVGAQTTLVEPSEVTNYFEQIGSNTGYIIHPEEVLADNFALLLTNPAAAKTPETLAKIKSVLQNLRSSEDAR